MAVTVIEMLSDSLRLINVIRTNQSPTAEMGVSGMRSLNELMADWAADGIRLGWHPVASQSEDLPLREEDLRAVKFNLACELAGGYGLDPPAAVLEVAKLTYARLAKLALQYFESDLDMLPTAEPYGTMAWPLG